MWDISHIVPACLVKKVDRFAVFHLSGSLGLSHGKYEEITSRYLHQGVSIIADNKRIRVNVPFKHPSDILSVAHM